MYCTHLNIDIIWIQLYKLNVLVLFVLIVCVCMGVVAGVHTFMLVYLCYTSL